MSVVKDFEGFVRVFVVILRVYVIFLRGFKDSESVVKDFEGFVRVCSDFKDFKSFFHGFQEILKVNNVVLSVPRVF